MARARRPDQLTRIVRNRSSRNGTACRVIVMHTTEGHNRPGISDITGLASFFDNASVQASSHYAVDQEGNSVRMVPDAEKAWTVTVSNPFTLNIEQIGFAASSKSYWVKDYHNGLRRCAEILADWSVKYDIPLRYSTSNGVCSHNDLPGDHWDPGPNYPFQYLIWWARYIKMHRQGKKLRAARYARFVRATQRRHGFSAGTTWYR